MPHEVIMPALGMAQDTGILVAWHVGVGDAVTQGDVLFEVETDKATMEVAAQVDGVLIQLRHGAGSEVPVGDVIAMIGEAFEPVAPAGDLSDAPRDELPDGATVIMPALGMTQDTGLIVAWHKGPGDVVRSQDILFEVETDKATMEVEAGHDGYVAALLAQAGQAAPVGDAIAIISIDPPDTTQHIKRDARPLPPAAKCQTGASDVVAPTTQPARKRDVFTAPGRIMASPKARRLALEQGLDLNRLVTLGHAQPYRVADIEVLKSLPAQVAIPQVSATRRLTSKLPVEGFSEFAAWAAKEAGLDDPRALMSAMAAACLEQDQATVAFESFGQTHSYLVQSGALGTVAKSDDQVVPDLILRDLRLSRITSVEMGAQQVPVLSIMTAGPGLSLTLECTDDSLSATQAITLLSNFAGRLEHPLRHLL